MFFMIMISSNFNFNFICVIVSSLTKLLKLGILLSTTVRAIIVAKLVILGILSLSSFILALREAVVAKIVILGIPDLTSFILELRVLLVTKLVTLGNLSSIFVILTL